MNRNPHLQALLELKSFGVQRIQQFTVLLAVSESRSSLEISQVTAVTRSKVWSALRSLSELVEESIEHPDTFKSNLLGRALSSKFSCNTPSILHDMGIYGLSNLGILLALDKPKSLEVVSSEVELSPATVNGIISTMPDLISWEYAVEGRRGSGVDRIFFRSDYADSLLQQCLN